MSSSVYETTTSGVVNVGARVGAGGEEATVAHGVKWRARLVDWRGVRLMAERVTSRTLAIMAKRVVEGRKGGDEESFLASSPRTNDGQLQFQLREDLSYDAVSSAYPHTAPQDLEADDELDLAFSTTSLNELSLDPVRTDGPVTVVSYAEVSFQDLVSFPLH